MRQQEYLLHLTIQSGEIVKVGLNSQSQISISCDISEIPSVHCTLLISNFKQDIGPLGSLKFEKNRPIASGFINFPQPQFFEFKELLMTSPPRPASIYLMTSEYPVNSNGDISIKKSGLSIDILDVRWRYPVF